MHATMLLPLAEYESLLRHRRTTVKVAANFSSDACIAASQRHQHIQTDRDAIVAANRVKIEEEGDARAAAAASTTAHTESLTAASVVVNSSKPHPAATLRESARGRKLSVPSKAVILSSFWPLQASLPFLKQHPVCNPRHGVLHERQLYNGREP